MAYTVKQIGKLAGVSVRALHYYEEIGLLKPAYYGTNGYRYYEEKELLLLQQILFFKELGFSLKQMQKVLGRSDFDILSALFSHRHSLKEEQKKIEQLLKTIENTIKHLKGTKQMKDKEFFNGFDTIKADPNNADEKLVLENLKEPKDGAPNKASINKKANVLLRSIADCIDKGASSESKEVLLLIEKHHALSDELHVATKEVYTALANLYKTHPTFRKQLLSFHKELPEYISKGMIMYAESELK